MTNIRLTPPVHGRFLGPNSTCSRKPVRIVFVLPFLAVALGPVGIENETASIETFESAGKVFIYQTESSIYLTICENQINRRGNCWWKQVEIFDTTIFMIPFDDQFLTFSLDADLFYLDSIVLF